MSFVAMPTARLSAALLLLLSLTTAVWLPLSHLQMDWPSVFALKNGILTVAGCVAVLLAIERRLAGDESRTAMRLRWFAQGTFRLTIGLGAMLVLTSMVAPLTYLAASTALPLQDTRLAALDAALGLDWRAALAIFNSQPWLAALLSWSYHTTIAQIGLMIGLLAYLGKDKELWSFIALYAITATIVLVVSIGVPAVGAMAFHAPDAAQTSNFNPKSGLWHVEAFLGLRSGKLTVIDLKDLEGVVQFPSFHTVLAILVPYALRTIPMVFWPSAALNAVIIVSTLPEGGHFLVDVIAGAAVAAASIYAVRRFEARYDATRPSAAAVKAASEAFSWRPVRASA